jgi:hypothetical protein
MGFPRGLAAVVPGGIAAGVIACSATHDSTGPAVPDPSEFVGSWQVFDTIASNADPRRAVSEYDLDGVDAVLTTLSADGHRKDTVWYRNGASAMLSARYRAHDGLLTLIYPDRDFSFAATRSGDRIVLRNGNIGFQFAGGSAPEPATQRRILVRLP